MQIKKIVVVIFVSLFLMGHYRMTALAQEDDYSSLKADHVAGNIERGSERIRYYLTLTKKGKVNYSQRILNKRLGELICVSEEERLDLFENVSRRYAAYVGRLVEYMIKKDMGSQKGETVDLLDKHYVVIKALRDNWEYDSAWWLLLQQDLDSIDDLKMKLEQI